MILESRYSLIFPTFQTFSKKGLVETLFFSFDQFSQKVSTNTNLFLENVQKVGKILGTYSLFKNVAFEKNLPAKPCFHFF